MGSFEGLEQLERIATHHKMLGRSFDLAVAISNNLPLGIAITLRLLRDYAGDVCVSACVQSYRDVYGQCPLVIQRVEEMALRLNLERWRDYLPSEDELQDGGVLGFVYDFWPRCYVDELRCNFARLVDGYLHAYLPKIQ